jgi:hypothetical protein
MDLRTLLDSKDLTLTQLHDYLGGLEAAERVRQATDLKRGQLAKLWTLAENGEGVALNDIVPEGNAPLAPVPFEGQNSLPLFRSFQKVFYRTSDGRIAGYNNSPVGWLVGPGYYILEHKNGRTFVDYTQVPTEKPAEWPPIKRNEQGISALVYGYMHDFLRQVYPDFLIGRAVKKGKQTPNYFVLIRAIG